MLHPVTDVFASRCTVSDQVGGQAVCDDGFGHVETGAGTDRYDNPTAQRLVAGGSKADFVRWRDIDHEAAFLQRAGGDGFARAVEGGLGLGDVRTGKAHGGQNAAPVCIKILGREFQVMRDDLVAEHPAREGGIERQALAERAADPVEGGFGEAPVAQAGSAERGFEILRA